MGHAWRLVSPSFFVGYPRDKEAAIVGNCSMTAFRIDEPAKIDRLYALALGLGGTDEGPTLGPSTEKLHIRPTFATQMAIN